MRTSRCRVRPAARTSTRSATILYEIHIDNGGNGQDNITCAFRFQTRLRDPNTFLCNVGPILSIDSPNWNNRQFYSVTRIQHGKSAMIGERARRLPGPLPVPRRTAAGKSYAAVYPGLAVGAHTLWRDRDTPVGTVTIDGGRVTRYRWPD